MEGFNIDFAHPRKNFSTVEEGRNNTRKRKLIGIIACLLLLAALFTHLHQMKNKVNDPYQYALTITPAWKSVPDVSVPKPKSAFWSNAGELISSTYLGVMLVIPMWLVIALTTVLIRKIDDLEETQVDLRFGAIGIILAFMAIFTDTYIGNDVIISYLAKKNFWAPCILSIWLCWKFYCLYHTELGRRRMLTFKGEPRETRTVSKCMVKKLSRCQIRLATFFMLLAGWIVTIL